MKKFLTIMLGIVFMTVPVRAQDKNFNSRNALKAKEMVQKAVAFYQANGLDKTIAAVNDTKGQFVDGELYVFIHSFEGINLARGDGNLKRLGTNVLNSKDPDGKLFVQEMIKIAKQKGQGETSYGFKNEKTGKI
ncbi:MAG: cache domain-containing protein [Candidatus Omnitrophica bacterium]|nr:cache domain-containing protein [Candidatus Omnitrophota bacterium]